MDMHPPRPASTRATSEQEQERIDFDTLLAQAMQVVSALAGRTWTDLQDHDPGVTILQALAFGTADLAYRHTLPLRDLLTAKDQEQGSIFPASFGPHQALTCSPITEDDYRRAILDLHSSDAPVQDADDAGASAEGYFYFRNARLIPQTGEEQLFYFYNPASRSFSYQPIDEQAQRFELAGGYHLYLEPMDGADRPGAERAIAQFLQNNRNVCESVRQTTWLQPQPGRLDIDIEVAGDDVDPARMLAQIFMEAESAVHLAAVRRSAAELAAQGVPFEAIYHGPRLAHGWITQLPPAYDYGTAYEINVGQLANRLQAIDGVASLLLLNARGTTGSAKKSMDASWSFFVPAGHYLQLWGRNKRRAQKEAAGDWIASFLDSVKLYRRGQRIEVAAAEFVHELDAWRGPAIHESPVTLPAGRYRAPALYHPVGRLLPPCYGLQEPPLSAAQKRLYQFLLPFEQELANACAQLANLPRLLAFDRPDDVRVWGRQWPFGEDDRADRWPREVHAEYAARLRAFNEGTADDPGKELALIAYLQSYFGARHADTVLPAARALRSSEDGRQDSFLAIQRAYLRDCSELHYERANLRIDKVSALQRRIAARLGFGAELFAAQAQIDLGNLPFYLVEHRALMPTEPDPRHADWQAPASLIIEPDMSGVILTIAADSALRIGTLIDFQLGADRPEVQAMVAGIERRSGSAGDVISLSAKDRSFLRERFTDLAKAQQAGTLRWRSSNVWLYDISHALRYAVKQDGTDGKTRIIHVPDAARPLPAGTVLSMTSQRPAFDVRVVQDYPDEGTCRVELVTASPQAFPADPGGYLWHVVKDRMDNRFSFAVSIVFNNRLVQDAADRAVRVDWITSLIREEMPAHIRFRLHWLDDEKFRNFSFLYGKWKSDGVPLGDTAYALLESLSLGALREPRNIGRMRIATDAQIAEAGKVNWKERLEYITLHGLFYVPAET